MGITPAQLDALRTFDTCTLANAIEHFGVRLRNQGFTDGGLHSLTPALPTVIGFAATAQVKSSNPPMTGRVYADRTDWWATLGAAPGPHIAVIENIDESPWVGAVAGEIHTMVLRRLGCVGLVTNGMVRDLPGLRQAGLAVLAGGVCPSHGYVHMLDFGAPVEVNGLEVATGDLLACDVHGVVLIPESVVADLPAEAARITSRERRIVDLCRAPGFSIEALRKEIEQ